ESNILWNTHTYVICAVVYVDPKPRVNMHNVTLGAAGKWPVPAVLALGESVDAVPDCPNQNSDNDDRDDSSSLALPSDLFKHFLLTSLGQATSPSLGDNILPQKFAPRLRLIF